MKQFLNKKLTTPEEIAFGKRYEEIKNNLKAINEKLDENYRVYWKMEGKYAIGTTPDPWATMGQRGFDYKYANAEDKAKENAEREAYYNNCIAPLKTKCEELEKELRKLDNDFCILLYGYDLQHYNNIKEIARIEKIIAELEAELVEDKKYLAKLKTLI